MDDRRWTIDGGQRSRVDAPSPGVDEHNAEAQAVWDAFNAGSPIRPPVVLGTGTQFFIYNDDLNPGGAVDWERYCTDADTMWDFQLRAAAWRAEHIAPYCDDPIGMPPNREAWLVRVDLQNFDEAAHLGAPVMFLPGQIPDTPPILAGDRKNALFDAGLPDPLTGACLSGVRGLVQEGARDARPVAGAAGPRAGVSRLAGAH